MKIKLLAILMLSLISSYAYSQPAEFVKGKDYKGFIFPKEHCVWGFPSENCRYTPSAEDIAKAEKILKDSIGADYIKANQRQYRTPPINKRTLGKYTRQYIGYLWEDGTVIIRIYLYRGLSIDEKTYSTDIISIQGGGSNHWSVDINLSTNQLSDMNVNGES